MSASPYTPVIVYVVTGLLGSLIEWAGKRWSFPPAEDLGRRLEGIGLDVFKSASAPKK